MPFLPDITHRLLAGRNLSQINSGISRQRTYGNPYGIGGPSNSNPDLPPEAYPHGVPPPGYQTSTAYAGGSAYGPTDTSLYPPSDSSMPPAASGVSAGPAYPSYPDLSGEPTVIVNQPYQELGVPVPEPYMPPDWVYPPSAGSTPPEAQLGPTPEQWPVPDMVQEQPYYNPMTENSFIPGLIAWNGPGQTNISDPEMAGMGGALTARFGLQGVQGGGIDFRRHIK